MKIRFYLFAGIISLLFSGCQISENIYFKEDGSGKISFDIDASGLMELAGDKMSEGKSKNMDSTFTFKQLFDAKKDSIAKLPKEEQARLKKLENMSVSMKMNTDEKKFLISMFTDFKKADELIDMMQGMKSLKGNKADMGASNPMSGLDNSANTDLKYSFDGITFKRSVTVKDKKLMEMSKDTTGTVKMMFATSMFTLKYHFPRKVKSVSNPDALYSEDRKTVTIPYSFIDYMEQPEKMSFEVVLEK